MAESQNIEWKESWRDEYLKWICGFANAQGGKKFKALQSAKILDSKAPKVQNEPLKEPLERTLGQNIVKVVQTNPKVTYDELAYALNVSRSTVKRELKRLIMLGSLERKGGKRYGHWEIKE